MPGGREAGLPAGSGDLHLNTPVTLLLASVTPSPQPTLRPLSSSQMFVSLSKRHERLLLRGVPLPVEAPWPCKHAVCAGVHERLAGTRLGCRGSTHQVEKDGHLDAVHERGLALPSFRSLIPFTGVLWFSSHRWCPHFVRFMAQNFLGWVLT